MADSTTLEIVNPTAGIRLRKTVLASRLRSLDNQRVALYWNAKPGGDVALGRVQERLQDRFPSIQLELIRSATPGPKEAMERAKTFAATIGATGDCGTWLARDMGELEKHGV